VQVHSVQSPQAQVPEQVRDWQVPQPVVDVVPIVHVGMPVISQPLVHSPSQLPKPESQAQTPLAQCAFAPQELPHMPQFVLLLERFASQPVAHDRSQSANQPVQMHDRLMQLALAPQLVAQSPQWLVSAARLASQPSAHEALQSP
jgi:hypothetical protein